MYFCYFVIIPLRKGRPFIWTNLNRFDLRMLSLVEIGPVVLEKKIFQISSMYFRYFVILLEKGGALHLKKLEFPSPKDAVCQFWLKLVQWFLRRLRWKCEEFTTMTMITMTDKVWSEKLTWDFSSGNLKTTNKF